MSEADSVPVVVAGAFNHQAQSGLTVSESVGQLLGRKEALLVLDNCEHVLEGVSEFVEPLIRSTSSLDVLLTSREGLGLAYEQQITVAPLPADGARPRPSSCSSHARSPDRRLVRDRRDERSRRHRDLRRARRSSPRHRARATRVRTLAPREIRERLSDRLRLLSGGRGRGRASSDDAPHGRVVVSAADTGRERLAEPSERVCRRVHIGGCRGRVRRTTA